jgi:hypothetical protein
LGFGIDSKGKGFYTVDLAKIVYPDTETMILPNGKKIERQIMKEYTPDPIKKTPSEMGWAKTVKFEDVVLLDVANPKNRFKIEKALYHRVYEISVEKYLDYHSCDICAHNNLGAKHHWLRAMPSGVYHICWVRATKFGRSASGPIQTIADREGTASPWVKLISEKKISKKEAKAILQRLQRAPNVDVAMFISDFEVV